MEKVAGLSWAVAKVVKEARESKGLTQGQLAGFAGLSEVYLSSLERGLRGDSINALIQIAGALRVSPSELMKGVEAELISGAQKPESPRGRQRRESRLKKMPGEFEDGTA